MSDMYVEVYNGLQAVLDAALDADLDSSVGTIEDVRLIVRQRDEARRECEQALRTAGTLRARVEELETSLRELAGFELGGYADEGTAVWRAREVLGLHGGTGEVSDRG